jgi:hypothetical protein
MLPWFPLILPDELLYSACARYAQMFSYPNMKDVNLDLFGQAHKTAISDFPSHLEFFVSILPTEAKVTVEDIIQHHTLLPLFAPFQPLERIQEIKIGMSQQGLTKARLGAHAQRYRMSEHLMCCRQCIAEDLAKYGFSYWHRSHQIAGINVCPIHHLRLQQGFTYNSRKTRHQYVALTSNLVDQNQTEFSPHSILLNLAKDIEWLLQNQPTPRDLVILQKHYLHLLAEKKLATYSGRVKMQHLIESFNNWLPVSIRNQLSLEPLKQDHSWLARLVRHPRSSQHPIRHLLLIQFLGHSAQSIFEYNTVQPFGNAPFPCLNTTCPDHLKKRIQGIKTKFTKDHGKPIGYFFCAKCGFIYQRTGPDQHQNDQFRYDRIPRFGWLWEKTLKNLWVVPNTSLRSLSKQLGVDPITAKRQAKRLQLGFRSRQKNPVTQQIKPKPLTRILYTLEPQKLAWKDLIKNYPSQSTEQLRSINPALYAWLYRIDKEWLAKNSPSKIKKRIRYQPNWKSRDQELQQQIVILSKKLLEQQSKPSQISITSLLREVNATGQYFRHRQHYPLTTATLLQYAESRVDFAIRRIQWVKRMYNQRQSLKTWQMVRLASLRVDLLQDQSIKLLLEQISD